MSRPGGLKNRIEIFRPSTVVDAFGGSTVSLSSLGTFWASVDRVSGSRSLQYETTSFGRPYSIVLRQNIDIEEDDEIVFNSKTLVISSIERDDDRSRYQTIIANEVYQG